MLLMAPWLFQMPLLSLPDLRHNFSFDVGLTYMGTIEIKATGFPWPLNPDDLHVRAIAPGLARCLSNVCSLDLMGLTGGFHIDDLRMLASLSSLTSLAVWFEGAGWPDLLTSPESIFPALRILKVGDTPRALLPTFFAKIGSRTLTSLTLFQPPYHESEAPVIAPVIQVVAQKWATTLRTLIFDLTDFALTAPGLAPLSMMTSLEHLGFTSHWEISLTDSELLATIGPLHNLVSLSVIGWRGLTIEALRHIANHVVHLKALDLTFYPPNDPPGPGTEYSGHTLDTLIVNATAIDGPYLRSIEATACHLHHVFPRLRTIDTSTQRSRQVRNDLAGRWERVQEYLREGCPLCSYFVPPNLSEMQ
jgi:hypothetical protein